MSDKNIIEGIIYDPIQRVTIPGRIVFEDGYLPKAPFIAVYFMVLSVIPQLKIIPKGLLDVNPVKFIDLFA